MQIRGYVGAVSSASEASRRPESVVRCPAVRSTRRPQANEARRRVVDPTFLARRANGRGLPASMFDSHVPKTDALTT